MLGNRKKALSSSNIKYLLAIYKLGGNNTGIQCVKIAELLKLTKPSVHKMVNTLKNMELVKMNLSKEVFFTEKGWQLAVMYNDCCNFIGNLFKAYISDENDIRFVSCAVLAEISNESLSLLYHAALNERSR